MGVYVSDIALILVWALQLPPSTDQPGKIEATRKWAGLSTAAGTCGVLPITDWGVDA